MAQYIYPPLVALEQVAQDLTPRLIADRPIFDILPMVNKDTHLLEWEQMDNYIGVQQARGLDGEPPRVKKVGFKQYLMSPGVYGEHVDFNETELTAVRQIGSFDSPLDLTDRVAQAQIQLKQRELDRIEQIGWLLLASGTFSVAGPNGSILHQDTFAMQTFTAPVGYATTATATPFADLRAIKLLHRGRSVSFGAGATLYVNQTTLNNILNNANPQDLFGRRVTGLVTINNVGDLNRLLAGDDLPQIAVYDEGYIDDNGTFQLYIPVNKAILVGKRPAGQTIGQYVMTRNANNPNTAPGPYVKVVDNGDRAVPRRIEVHAGHNGGPVLFYAGSIVVINC